VVSDHDRIDTVVAQLNAGSARRAAVLLPDGSAAGDPVTLPSDVRRRAFEGEAFSVDAAGHRIVLVPVSTGGHVSVAEVAVPSSQLRRGVAAAWVALATLGAVLIALGVGLADRLGRSTVRSMASLEHITRRLQEGDLDARADGDGPPEVAHVAGAVNDLADQIQGLLAAEREAAADLSHRLRTPLTALQLQFDSVRDEDDRARLADSVRQLTDEVSAVIDAARRERPETRRTCDLADVVDRRIAFWRVLARQEARELTWSRPGSPSVVPIAEDELVAAIDALLANVFHHTPSGTPFAVRIEDGADGHPLLVVEDGGPGFPSGDVTRRGTSAGGSTGLGIDIAKRTAERGGGTLRIGSAKTGGARVELVLVSTPT
jgi:signal transduction histidine kinase